MKNIVILISGGGSNMAAIVKTAKREGWGDKFGAKVAAVISNKASAVGLVFAQEHGIATEVLDHAMQTFGAMGVTKELPLHLMAQKARVMRVYEGPSEVHRMSIAKKILKTVK